MLTRGNSLLAYRFGLFSVKKKSDYFDENRNVRRRQLSPYTTRSNFSDRCFRSARRPAGDGRRRRILYGLCRRRCGWASACGWFSWPLERDGIAKGRSQTLSLIDGDSLRRSVGSPPAVISALSLRCSSRLKKKKGYHAFAQRDGLEMLHDLVIHLISRDS